MTDHPTCEEFVVSRIQMIFSKPIVVSKAMKEFWILKDDGAVCGSTPRETRNTTIDVSSRGNLNVSNAETHGSKNLPNRHFLSNRLNALRSPNATNFLVLKRSEHGWEHGWWP